MKGTAAVPGRGFVHHVRQSSRTSKPFLELMAGTCRLAKAVADRGVPSEGSEITRSVVEDIMSTADTASIRNRIKRHRVTGIWIGIACASWIHGLGHDVGTLTNEAFRLRCVMTLRSASGVSWTFQKKTRSVSL